MRHGHTLRKNSLDVVVGKHLVQKKLPGEKTERSNKNVPISTNQTITTTKRCLCLCLKVQSCPGRLLWGLKLSSHKFRDCQLQPTSFALEFFRFKISRSLPTSTGIGCVYSFKPTVTILVHFLSCLFLSSPTHSSIFRLVKLKNFHRHHCRRLRVGIQSRRHQDTSHLGVSITYQKLQRCPIRVSCRPKVSTCRSKGQERNNHILYSKTPKERSWNLTMNLCSSNLYGSRSPNSYCSSVHEISPAYTKLIVKTR